MTEPVPVTAFESWKIAAKKAREAISNAKPITVTAGSKESVDGVRSEKETVVEVYPSTPSYQLAEFMKGYTVLPSGVAEALELEVEEVMALLRGILQFDWPLVEAAIREHRVYTTHAFLSRPIPKED